MPRETKAQFAARVARSNEEASQIAIGSVHIDMFFGEVTLVSKAQPDEQGWDQYVVSHSGFQHVWSSASVVAAFGKVDA